MDLVDLVIRARKQIPREEFDLRRQIFKAVTSIPFNIAEGYRRKKRRGAYQNHVSIALGSQGELETAIEVARAIRSWRESHAWKFLRLPIESAQC